MKNFPCVAIIGARQVGKTTLLKQLKPKAPFFDLERMQDLQRISDNPEFFLSQYDECIIIDEAQSLPSLFNALRVRIDERREQNGQFLISGSSSPELLKSITESLAGRVAIFELSPLNIFESWEQSISQFPSWVNEKKITLPKKKRFTEKQIEQSFLQGGYPDIVLNKNNSQYFRTWMDNYTTTYLKRDIRNLFPNLDIINYQKFLSMLADTTGSLINYSEYGRSLDVSQPTAKSYFQIASGSFFWRVLPSFEKNIEKRITKMPKGWIVDSGLNNFLLQIANKEKLFAYRRVGLLWEAFVAEQIIRTFKEQLVPVQAFHYRTHNGDEIDLILQGEFGIIPIAIKLGRSVDHKKLRAMERFIREQKVNYGVVINNAKEACWLSRQIAQIPVTYL